MTTDIIGIYFDFFGTLIDSRYAVTKVWSLIAKRLGMEIDSDDLLRLLENCLKF